MIKKVENKKQSEEYDFKCSKRVYISNNSSSIKVPMREVSLSSTQKPDGSQEKNEPVRLKNWIRAENDKIVFFGSEFKLYWTTEREKDAKKTSRKN